jgi:hypothetical protein
MMTSSSSGTITVRRPALPWGDRFRSYRILLDGQPVGKIANGEDVSFSLDPGRHPLQLTIDWTGSQVLETDLSAGRNIVIRVERRPVGMYSRNGYLVLSAD